MSIETPTEEAPMGARALDNTRLREVVGQHQDQMDQREVVIHTRAQQRLADDSARAEELDGEIAKDEDYALRTRNNISELQRLLTQTEANIKNSQAEREACLVSVHNLRLAGITL